MIKPLFSNVVMGIDLVIARYQACLEKSFPEWAIYPRLEQRGDDWYYYKGEGNDSEQIKFTEQSNIIGFGVGDITPLGNQQQADLTVLVGMVFDKKAGMRDIQLYQNKISEALHSTYQTTEATIGAFSQIQDYSSHPKLTFTIKIEQKFIPSYKQKA